MVGDVDVHPFLPAHIYCATSGGGISVRERSAAAWETLNNKGLTNRSINAVAPIPGTPGKACAASHGNEVFYN